MKIVDITEKVDDRKEKVRDFDKIRTLAVHRVGRLLNRQGQVVSNLGRKAEEICGRFISDPEVAKYTGGELAYTFIIEEDGTIKQCLPIDDVGQHAKRWNATALGVAVVGDFRYEEPTPQQHTALVDLLVALAQAWALDPMEAVKGHSELPGGSSTPEKRCPGPLLDMHSLRAEVRDFMRDAARQKLSEAGLAWKKGD
jgi:N-acetyl-anhydromuramyl-L-alanine amidase AmpD